jgi:hypothetical protein
LAIDDSASIFCARLIRGTMSMAMTVAPCARHSSSSASFCAGQKKEISVCPSRRRFVSSSDGPRTLMTTSAACHSASALDSTSTPAAL